MLIRPFKEGDQDEVIQLVLHCQNDEFQLNIPLTDQVDLLRINHTYIQTGGHFWVALIDDTIVGCIGLLKKTATTGVLKKFFVYPNYRGAPYHIGSQLYQSFLDYAQAIHLQQVILDTPARAKRSHNFYLKAGFTEIAFEELPLVYDFPDRDSLYFLLAID